MEEVVRFSGLKQRRQLTYGAKQLIAREVSALGLTSKSSQLRVDAHV